MSVGPEDQPSNPFESPYFAEEEPDLAVAFYQGKVAAFTTLGLMGTRLTIGDEAYRALTENDLKQLAVDNAWNAISILRENQNPKLDEIAQALLELTDRLPNQTSSTRAPDLADQNS